MGTKILMVFKRYKPAFLRRITAFLVLTIFIPTPGISVANMVEASAQPPAIAIDGNAISFPDVQPFIDGTGNILTPAGYISEALGAAASWEPAAKTVTVIKGNVTVQFIIGKNYIKINGSQVPMDTAAVAKDGRIFLPVGHLAEALGCPVSYNNSLQRMEISLSASETTQEAVSASGDDTGSPAVQYSTFNQQAEFKAGFEKPAASEILETAGKYYKLAKSKATAEELRYIGELVPWVPDFTGRVIDAKSAVDFSYLAAFLTTYTDLENVFLALNAAVFTLDVKNPVSAGNLASAIAAYSEEVKNKPLALIFNDNTEFVNDAAKVYKYALSLTSSGETISPEALPLLLNYGNYCIDTGDLKTAKQLFETALGLAPDYYPASEGMAAYWLASGDKIKAEDILKKAKKPALYGVIAKNSKNTTEDVAPQVTIDQDLPVMKEKLEKLAKVPTVLATDFYEDIDPKGAADIRRFVDNLSAEWKYTVPKYDYLSQYSTLQAFDSGQGQAALAAFGKELEEFTKKNAKAAANLNRDLIGGMGLELDAGGIDINDLIQNPEKYEDMDVDIKVKGLDAFMNNMKDMAGQAEAGMKDGNFGALGNIVSTVSPELTILSMKPGDYANPTDVLTQKYNMTIMMRKLVGYKNYSFKQNEDITEEMKVMIDNFLRKMSEADKRMQDELEALAREHESSHDARVRIQGGPEILIPQEGCDKCKIKKHAIHENYNKQKNNISETSFGNATNYINTQFIQKLKPDIETMYADCMKNCMLISDPKIRKLVEDKIYAEVYMAVANAFLNVSTAYSVGPGGYPYICDCDPDVVEAAKERERQKFEEAEEMKTVMENRARKEFEAGVIKESSQLYQRLDKYSAHVKLMFFEGKWHPLKTEVNFKAEIPAGKIKVGGNLNWVTEHVRNTTTYGGGLSASVSGDTSIINAGDAGKAGFSGSLSLQGQITTDGAGNIVRSDVIGSASGTISAGMHEATGTVEVSTMRGCKLSGEVTRLAGDTLKPPNAVEAWDDFSEAIGSAQPEKPKKVLWKGEYKLSE